MSEKKVTWEDIFAISDRIVLVDSTEAKLKQLDAKKSEKWASPMKFTPQYNAALDARNEALRQAKSHALDDIRALLAFINQIDNDGDE